MGMRVPALYFTLWTSEQSFYLSFSRLCFCSLSLSCHCPLLLLPCTGAGLGHLWVCLSSLKLIDWKLAILYPKNPPAGPRMLAASFSALAWWGVTVQGLLASCMAVLGEHWFQLPAVLACHKPLPSPQQAFPPSWENSGTFSEVFGWMEDIKCYLPVPVQHGMPCLV